MHSSPHDSKSGASDELSEQIREGGRRSLASLLRWIGTHVRGFHAAIGAFLILGLSLVVGAILLFAAVAALVTGGLTERVDRAILLWLDARGGPWLDGMALEVTALGSAYVTIVVAIIASLFLWQTRHQYSAALLWVALAGSWIISRVLKSIFDRPRPELFEWRVPFAGASSYPSGHALSSMVVYATLAYLVLRLEPTRAIKRLTIFVFGFVISTVGISRVYLGVHYPSDVAGGFLVGFAWATICALGMEAIQYFRTRRPEVVGDERGLLREGFLGGKQPKEGDPLTHRAERERESR